MANSIDFRGLDHRIQRLSAKKTLAKNRKKGTLDEVRWINLFSGGQNDKFAASKLLPDSNNLGHIDSQFTAHGTVKAYQTQLEFL